MGFHWIRKERRWTKNIMHFGKRVLVTKSPSRSTPKTNGIDIHCQNGSKMKMIGTKKTTRQRMSTKEANMRSALLALSGKESLALKEDQGADETCAESLCFSLGM